MNGTGNLNVNCANSVPRFEVVDKDGRLVRTFDSKWAAVYWADQHMPGRQDSNEGPEPDGWYIQIAEAE